MPVKLLTRSRDETTLTTNTTNTIKLPRDYYIQKILLHFELTYTNGATAPTFVEDAPFTLINRLRLELAGYKNVTLVDVTPKSYVSLVTLDSQIAPYSDTLGTTASTQYTVDFSIPIDFRINKDDDYDTSAVIPSFAFSSVELKIDVGTASDLASANAPTIDSLKVTPMLVELVTDEEFSTFEYYLVSRNVSISATGTQRFDLETGKILRRLLLLTKDSSGNRSNSIINDYAVLVGETPIRAKTKFKASRFQDRLEYGINPDTGVTILDFANYNDVMNSLDLTNAKEGDVKLECDVASTGSFELLYNWIL